MISFIIGFTLGGFLGVLILAIFVAGKSETDTEDGVSYGLRLNRDNGAIIATNNDEIMVEYKDGMTKRFREVKELKEVKEVK
jgi:hypothetical protein